MYGPPPCRKRKNESDMSVCANVYGLCWSTMPLAMMECAAPSSYLVMQSWKTASEYRFGGHRVRPLCHLMLRQQTWQKRTSTRSRWAVDVGIANAISKPGSARRHLQASQVVVAPASIGAR